MLEILGKIGFDWQLAVANLVNFIVVFYVLKLLVFKPIEDGIHARQEKVNKSLADAEAARLRLATAEEESNEILRTAKLEATEIVSKASSKAGVIEENAHKTAVEEKAMMIAEAEREIARAEKEMQGKLAESAAELAIMAAEKIIQEDVADTARTKYTARMTK